MTRDAVGSFLSVGRMVHVLSAPLRTPAKWLERDRDRAELAIVRSVSMAPMTIDLWMTRPMS